MTLVQCILKTAFHKLCKHTCNIDSVTKKGSFGKITMEIPKFHKERG